MRQYERWRYGWSSGGDVGIGVMQDGWQCWGWGRGDKVWDASQKEEDNYVEVEYKFEFGEYYKMNEEYDREL